MCEIPIFSLTMRIKCLTNEKDSGKSQNLEKLGVHSLPLSANMSI